MPFLAEIILPVGKNIVRTREIATLIADALRNVALAELVSVLPNPTALIGRATLGAMKFNGVDDRIPNARNYILKQCEELLRKDIESGALVQREPICPLPTKQYFPTGIVKVDEFSRFAERFDVLVRVETELTSSLAATPAEEVPSPNKSKPVRTKLRDQERAVVSKLMELKYNPFELPTFSAKVKPDVKAKCWEAVLPNPLFGSGGRLKFDKAWQRLLDQCEIKRKLKDL